MAGLMNSGQHLAALDRDKFHRLVHITQRHFVTVRQIAVQTFLIGVIARMINPDRQFKRGLVGAGAEADSDLVAEYPEVIDPGMGVNLGLEAPHLRLDGLEFLLQYAKPVFLMDLTLFAVGAELVNRFVEQLTNILSHILAPNLVNSRRC